LAHRDFTKWYSRPNNASAFSCTTFDAWGDIFGKPIGMVLTSSPQIGTAPVAGGYWRALSAAGMSTGALIISHVAWDITVFLIAPTVSE
jgi:hypothetical protein